MAGINEDGIVTLDDDAVSEEAAEDVQPLFRIYEGSRVAVGKAVGQIWKRRLDAAMKAYQATTDVWDQVIRYYNNSQDKSIVTPRGVFKRGDETENVIFSNTNITLPAIYSKDPDVTCSTGDDADQPFCDALEKLLNVLFRRKDKLNAKPKIKKAAGLGLLTNYGVLKLDNVLKDDSREYAAQEMQRLTDQLGKVTDTKDAERLYGEMEALESQMEMLEPSGPKLKNVLPANLIIDPHAELPDGSDAQWMIERIFYATAALNARFTKESDDDDVGVGSRVLVYKPTHKAIFSEGTGDRDDGLGMVMQELGVNPSGDGSSDDERTAYINMYYTECYLVWDKTFRRIMLFHRDDWAWPLWVWDDMHNLTRFFPYFIIGFSLSTGGTVSVGETAYYLDQQDKINDIHRQLSKIRRAVFTFFVYNSEVVDPEEAKKFIAALRGDQQTQEFLIGVKAGDQPVSKMIEAIMPPSLSKDFEMLFSTQPVLDSINRISNTSDALRGVQFKTNTNVAAVNTYQESMRLSVGSKVDVVEDVVADIAIAMAELCIQFMSQEEVVGLIGERLAQGWQQMSVEQFNATYSVEVVAGSMEKPNSVFKKKEAVQISQAVGQFAQAAPGATLRIMLRVLEQAFSEVVIKKEDWDALDAEIEAATRKGVSEPSAGGAGSGQDELLQQAQNLPPEVKQKIMEMRSQGAPAQEIVQFIQQQVQQRAGATNGAASEPAVQQ